MKDAPGQGTGSKPKRAKTGKRKKTTRRIVVGGAVATLAVLGGRFGLQRVARPAEPSGPLSEPAKALVEAAWKGIDPQRAVDCHVHIVGLGTGDTGCAVNPNMRSLWHPGSYLRFEIYRRAAGIDDLERADQQYVARLASLARQQLAARRGDKSQPQPFFRLHILAFDRAHRPDGSIDEAATEFFVPNDYVLGLARQNPEVFLPCGSIHPYRKDALAELERLAAEGIRCIKWLPSAMRIDPASEQCDTFYDKLAALNIPLLTHGGQERAVDVAEAQKYANPLRLRRALDKGVKVIVCHCASSGRDEDLDAAGDSKPLEPSFELFLRMMDDPRYAGLLYGDVSALAQHDRAPLLARILERTDLHTRLVNGSDYPLPAINALLRTGDLVEMGYLSEQERELLNEIDQHNPLLFDFVLKRTVRRPRSEAGPRGEAGHGGEQLAPSVFMPPADLFPG